MAPKHPYYPLNAKIVGYQPMVLNMGYILAVFGGSMALVAILTWYISGMHCILQQICCSGPVLVPSQPFQSKILNILIPISGRQI
jgi:hypothetical protein